MDLLAVLLLFCTSTDGLHANPAALDRLELLRETSRSILHASGLSHLTRPIADLWVALTTIEAYINHYGLTYVQAQAAAIEIPVSSSSPAAAPAPLWAILFEPNSAVLPAELSSASGVLRELQLIDDHPLLDSALLVISSVRGYFDPPVVPAR